MPSAIVSGASALTRYQTPYAAKMIHAARGIRMASCASRRRATPCSDNRDHTEREEGAPVGQMEEKQEEDEDALRGGPDRQAGSPAARGACA